MEIVKDQVLTCLRAAKKNISNPENWTKGMSARGKTGAMTSPNCDDAYKFCAVGAVLRTPLDAQIVDQTLTVLLKALPKGYGSVAYFNDMPERTHAEVLEIFDKAIKSTEKLK